MEEVIRSLPEGYRGAVRLAEVEGLSQQEVADRLGLSLSGAKSRVQRGRVLLKGVLDVPRSFSAIPRAAVGSPPVEP
jgi:RNA polymerase sigma-70 factor, ECF subfamily